MDHFGGGALLSIAAYCVGSLPFGYLTGRVVGGIDIRKHGSGNIGATNVGRVLGSKWGLVVLGLDFLKGFVPVAVLPRLFLAADNPDLIHWQVIASVATILGHVFPFWLGFRGGKGVATALGVVAWLAPWPTLIAAGVFGLSFALWRIVSLSSIFASLAFGIAQIVWYWGALFSESHWSLTAFSLLVPALILVRHRANIARLWRGEEKRFGRTPEKPGDSPAAT